MAKKKTEAVVYTPLSQSAQIENTLSEIQLKVVPPYPDKGVSYAGYSKKQIGNNDYQLMYQVVKTASIRIDNTTAPSNTIILLRGQTFYLTDIIISSRNEAGIATPYPFYIEIGVRVGVAGAFTSFFTIPYNSSPGTFYNASIHLKTPIAMSGSDPNLDLIAIKDAINGGDDMRVTIVGWLE